MKYWNIKLCLVIAQIAIMGITVVILGALSFLVIDYMEKGEIGSSLVVILMILGFIKYGALMPWQIKHIKKFLAGPEPQE